MRADALGYKNALVKTPILDRIASGGISFDRAYCATDVCPPSRASLLTGRYPASHGLTGVGIALRDNEITLSDTLRKKGYYCAVVGKSHIRPQCADGFSGTEEHPKPADPAYKNRARSDGTYFGFDEWHITEDFTDGEYTDYLAEKSVSPKEYPQTSWITERSIDIIKKTNAPLFLWISYTAPHPPCSPPREFLSLYQGERFHKPIPRRETGRPEYLKTQNGHPLQVPVSKQVCPLKNWKTIYGGITQ
jgi:arylsulfatase A-like enzyme